MGNVTNFWTHFFDYKGTCKRKEYWLGLIINGVFLFVVWFFLSFLLGISAGSADAEEATFVGLAVFIAFLIGIIFLLGYLSSSARRLRDSGFPALLLLMLIVPFLTIVIFVLTCLPTKKENRH